MITAGKNAIPAQSIPAAAAIGFCLIAAIAAGAINSDLFSHDSAEQFAKGLVRNLAEQIQHSDFK